MWRDFYKKKIISTTVHFIFILFIMKIYLGGMENLKENILKVNGAFI